MSLSSKFLNPRCSPIILPYLNTSRVFSYAIPNHLLSLHYLGDVVSTYAEEGRAPLLSFPVECWLSCTATPKT